MKRLLPLLVLMPSLACAAIYAYIDDSGRTFIVDRLRAVPEEYRDVVEKVDGKYDGLSTAERGRLKAEENARIKARREEWFSVQRAHREARGPEVGTAVVEGPLEEGELRIKVDGETFQVPATLRLGGKQAQAWLTVDTGATRTFVHDAVARKLGLPVDKTPRRFAMVVNGERVKAGRAFISGIRVGTHARTPFTIRFAGGEGAAGTSQGAIGMDFLQHFDYDVDLERAAIRLRPRAQ